jgi:GGDEF domain-containing protein
MLSLNFFPQLGSPQALQFGRTKKTPRSAAVRKAQQLEAATGELEAQGVSPDRIGHIQTLATALKESTIRLARAAQRQRDKARTDVLTGLPSRREVDRRMGNKTKKPLAGPTSCIVIDLDEFGKINKSWGLVQGDKVLKKVGRTLKKLIRDTDVLRLIRPDLGKKKVPTGQQPFEGRLGGEEFCIILPNTDEKGVSAVIERLLRCIPKITQDARIKAHERREKAVAGALPLDPFLDMATQRDITASIGAVTLPTGVSTTPQTIFGLADYAMRIAKHGPQKVAEDEKRPDLLQRLLGADPSPTRTRNRGFVISGLDPADTSQWTPEHFTLQFVANGPDFMAVPAKPFKLKAKGEAARARQDAEAAPSEQAV